MSYYEKLNRSEIISEHNTSQYPTQVPNKRLINSRLYQNQSPSTIALTLKYHF